MSILTNQKNHIEGVTKEIVNVNEVLQDTSQAILNHIDEASVVDRKLEQTKSQLESYSKKLM